tara:strand:- start:480 stop:989 length:510 start_codon:yes stop_codon:yes gene_type:complete
MSNLRLINETIASSVASLSITDIFSADFDIYKLNIYSDGFSGNSALDVRYINSSGSIVTASEYDYARQLLKADTTFSEDRSTNQNKYYTGELSDNGLGQVLYLFNPYSSSSYTFSLFENQSMSSTNGRGGKGIAVLTQTNLITGIHLYSDNSGTITNLKVRTYGLRVDS